MSDANVALLRQLLNSGSITQAQFDQLAGGASAASAAVGRDNTGNLNTGHQEIGEQQIHHHYHGAAPTGPDPASLLNSYLRKLLEGRNSDGLARLVVDEATPQLDLASVYTALLTDGQLDRGPAQGAEREREPVSAVAMLDAHRRLVLLGDPGSGKSSFVNLVAMCLAGEALRHPQINVELLTTPLPGDEADAELDEQPARQRWRHGALLPLRVELRQLIAGLPAVGHPADCNVICAQIAADLQRQKLGSLEPHVMAVLEGQVPGQRALLLLDGLDEVPDADQRRTQVRDAVTDFARRFADCRILVTARTYAYQSPPWQLKGFARAEIQPFNEAQVDHFVNAWYGALADRGRLTPDEAAQRAAALRDGLRANARVLDLARRPLLLTLMVQLQGTRPVSMLFRSRQSLYEQAVQVLLNTWEDRKSRVEADGRLLVEPSLSEWLGTDVERLRRRLEQLAFEAHARQSEDDHAGGKMVDIAERDLVFALLQAQGHQLRADPRVLVQYLQNRAGLLAAQSSGSEAVYRFPHRSFQEYLAACWLTDADDFPTNLAELARQDADRWREVLLLAAAKAEAGTRNAPWQLADELCPDEPGPGPIGRAEAWGALLAGQVLCEVLDPSAVAQGSQVPKRERVRRWQLALLQRPSPLPLRERARAGRQLATLGDPRPEIMTLDGMQFCWVPAGPFTMGDAGEQQVVDLAYPYAMARFPVSVAQFAEYLRDRGTTAGDRYALAEPGNHPAARVDWHESTAFCAWLGRRWQAQLPAGWHVALPTEQEWEKAARGGRQLPERAQWFTTAELSSLLSKPPKASSPNPQPARTWPWGDEKEPGRANVDESGIGWTCALGMFPAGASPYGCEDLAGNVLEWTDSNWDSGIERVLRGGGCFNYLHDARCALRYRFGPVFRGGVIGFRVLLRCAPES